MVIARCNSLSKGQVSLACDEKQEHNGTMNIDLTDIASLWGALSATAAAIVAWRVYLWQRQSDVPVVLCEVTAPTAAGEWWEVKVTIRNGTTTRWKSQEVRIERPTKAIGFSQFFAPTSKNGYGETVPDYVAARTSASRNFPMRAKTDPAGTPRHAYAGGGDVSRERTFLHLPKGSRKLKMKLVLMSMDGKPRKFTVPIERDLTSY